jgi:hypothetical protein
MSSIVDQILQRLGQPDLVQLLSEKVSGSELNSILLEVFNKKTAGINPAQLLHQYQLNRFVKPADLPALDLRRMELDLLELFSSFSFQPIELSPVAALGSCSAVASVDQKKVLTALRGTEVLADATNSIALHFSDLKKSRNLPGGDPAGKFRFSVIQRHLRTQAISAKGFTPHFKIACLVTCGSDSGSYTFERESLREHVTVMTSLYKEYYKVEQIRFRLLARSGYTNGQELLRHVGDFVRDKTGAEIEIVNKPEKEIDYYRGIQYKIDIVMNGKQYEIGDGGFVDWTQKLLENKKERMLSTGIGFEFMYRIMNGQL